MEDLFSVHEMLNLQRPLAKIDYYSPLAQPSPLFETQPVRAHNFIGAKANRESALLLLSECQDFAIQYQLARL